MESSSFEFSTTASADMCAADDVILCGRLLPFGAPPPHRPRRSSSLGDLPRGSMWGGKIKSVYDYQKLTTSQQQQPKRTPMRLKSKWYVLGLGSGRVLGEMDMEDIRTRQRRRPPPRRDAADAEWGPWKLLRSLSCKAMEAIIVS